MTLTLGSGEPATDSSFNSSTTALKLPNSDQESPMNLPIQTLRTVELLEPDSPRPPGESEVRAPAARCADGNGTMTGLFFSDNVIDIARAKAMCGLCPLQGACASPRRSNGKSRGACGAENCSPAAAS